MNYQSLIRKLTDRGVSISDVKINQINPNEYQYRIRYSVPGDRKWKWMSFHVYKNWLGTSIENMIIGAIMKNIRN